MSSAHPERELSVFVMQSCSATQQTPTAQYCAPFSAPWWNWILKAEIKGNMWIPRPERRRNIYKISRGSGSHHCKFESWLLSHLPRCLGGWSGCTCSIWGGGLLQSQALFKYKAFPLASVLLEYFSIEKCEHTRKMSSMDMSCGFIFSVQGRKVLC